MRSDFFFTDTSGAAIRESTLARMRQNPRIIET